MDLLTANDVLGDYPASFYASQNQTSPRAKLEGKVEADVAIIGAGLTGLSAARSLARQGKSVIVLEASRIGFGASGRNGGQIGMGQRVNQIELEKRVGFEKAKMLFEIGNRAAGMAKELAGDAFSSGVGHACFDHKQMQEEHDYANYLKDRYGYEGIENYGAEAFRNEVASPTYHGGTIDWNAGHTDPLMLTLKLASEAEAAGACIYENSRVLDLSTLETESGSVSAGQVILAMNGYHNDLSRLTARYVMPINNFIIATEPLGEIASSILPSRIAVADSKFVVNYFRLSKDGRMLFGGGESYGYRFPKDIAQKARVPMVKIFPQLKDVRVDYAWGGTLAITMSRMPYVRSKDQYWESSGYSGHGLALSIFCGDMIARAMSGDDEDFQKMQSIPNKSFPGGAQFRHPLLVGAMLWFQLRDALGL